MHSAKLSLMVLALCVFCRPALAQQALTVDQVIDRIVTQEQAETKLVRQYSPLVEIYIQQVRPDNNLGTVPNGDQYFLGRAELAKGIDVEPLTNGDFQTKAPKGVTPSAFMPREFLQMIFIDASDFDRQHYKFDYVGRECWARSAAWSSMSPRKAKVGKGERPLRPHVG